MSSRRRTEEEYNSDDDEDFVPDAADEEEAQEIQLEDGEQDEETLKLAANVKKSKTSKSPSLPPRKRKGPFDSEDDLSEPEVDEEVSEPPAKRPKLEESEEAESSKSAGPPAQEKSAVDDFYAAMMKGRAPGATSKPTSRPGSATPQASVSSTSDKKESSSEALDPNDPMAFFKMMKKSSPSVSSSAGTSSTSGSKSSTNAQAKMAVPASWIQADSTGTDETQAEIEKSSALAYDDKKVTIKESYEYAGQRIEIERKVDVDEAAELNSKKGASGLGNILDQLKGKNKITTLQKSKLDWNQYTDASGLEDEFVKNRKDGYLGKQEFLSNAADAEAEAARHVRARARTQRGGTL